MNFIHFLAPFMMLKKSLKCNVLLPAWCHECIYCGAKTETTLPGLKADKHQNQKKGNSEKGNYLKRQRA